MRISPSVYVCVHLSVYTNLSLFPLSVCFISMFIPSVYLFDLFIYASVTRSASLFYFVSLYILSVQPTSQLLLSSCPFLPLSICPYIRYMYICLWLHLSACLPVRLFVLPSVHLSFVTLSVCPYTVRRLSPLCASICL